MMKENIKLFDDFWVEMKSGDSIRKIFIEIKPFKETQPPKQINEGASLKEHRAFNRAAETYLIKR